MKSQRVFEHTLVHLPKQYLKHTNRIKLLKLGHLELFIVQSRNAIGRYFLAYVSYVCHIPILFKNDFHYIFVVR